MMEKNRTKWNERYQQEPHPKPPSPVVRRFCARAPRGLALDIACGTGGNAGFLAGKGFAVDAVDISDAALGILSQQYPAVNAVHADLDTYEILPDRYTLILNIRFLNRRLFPYIKEALLSGGMLIFETFVEPPRGHALTVSCRDYLLRENELLHAFLSLHVIHYEEKSVVTPRGKGKMASLVGIKR